MTAFRASAFTESSRGISCGSSACLTGCSKAQVVECQRAEQKNMPDLDRMAGYEQRQDKGMCRRR